MNTGLEYLDGDNPGERWRIVSDMQKKGRLAIEQLTQELRSEDKWIRIAAADALGNIGDLQALDPLAALLSDSDHDVRFATVIALGKLGGPTARRALEGACRDTNCYVRMAAEEVLNRKKEEMVH